MSAKRKSNAAAAPRRRKKAPADWRMPIFYWHGSVTGNTWEGTWVASADGLPSAVDFQESANTFKLECSDALPSICHDSSEVGGAGAILTGSYKLDNGDGLADYSDIEHQIWAYNGPPEHRPSAGEWTTIGACGDTEFGRFVSLGQLSNGRLTLARRYITNDDPRVKMSAMDIVGRVASIGPDRWACDAPWLALPWKVSADWPEPLSVDPALMAICAANCGKTGTDCWVGVKPCGGL